jgi:hypothetical protein
MGEGPRRSQADFIAPYALLLQFDSGVLVFTPGICHKANTLLTRTIQGRPPPRSKPLRSRAMGPYLEEARLFEW